MIYIMYYQPESVYSIHKQSRRKYLDVYKFDSANYAVFTLPTSIHSNNFDIGESMHEDLDDLLDDDFTLIATIFDSNDYSKWVSAHPEFFL